MSYEYTDPKRANDDHALPDVEVFHHADYPDLPIFDMVNGPLSTEELYYYVYGFPGCLWDSDTVGPFDSYEEALEDARENAGIYEEEED